MQLKINKLEPKLKNARAEHEKTTDMLFEEKKNNIKLMKSVQQFKMNNHQNEYFVKELKEQNIQLRR